MKDLNEYIDHLIDISKNIELGKVTILTGKNGAGKSLIRKLLPASISEKLNLPEGKNSVASTSQELRTGSNPEWGALSRAMCDVGWTPTSVETIDLINGLLGVKDRFIVIDEPEIGMGEETVFGLVDHLNKSFNPLTSNIHGVLVITHSRIIATHLQGEFINIEGMSREEWLTRKVVPTDLEQLKKDSNELFDAIQTRINDNKKKKQ